MFTDIAASLHIRFEVYSIFRAQGCERKMHNPVGRITTEAFPIHFSKFTCCNHLKDFCCTDVVGLFYTRLKRTLSGKKNKP